MKMALPMKLENYYQYLFIHLHLLALKIQMSHDVPTIEMLLQMILILEHLKKH